MNIFDVYKMLKIEYADIGSMVIGFPNVKGKGSIDSHGGHYEKGYCSFNHKLTDALKMGVPFHIDFFMIEGCWLEDKMKLYTSILYREDGTPYIFRSEEFLFDPDNFIFNEHNLSLVEYYRVLENT